ncbi:hypothetical protein GE061_000445, partial [Apolygus lucorum]
MVDRLVNSEANARRIEIVEQCFGSGQPLAVQGRVLVGEGVKKKYNKQHVIPLEEVKLESLDDEGHLRNGWLICTASKSFAVFAATSTEKHEWMAHIDKCIEDLLKKSGKKAAEEHAAVWVPDAEANVCMHCKRNQFTVLNRRINLNSKSESREKGFTESSGEDDSDDDEDNLNNRAGYYQSPDQ